MPRVLSRDELVQLLTIGMAAANRNPPVLRGKASPRDPWERDKFRHNFASWFVETCIEGHGLRVVTDGLDPKSHPVIAAPAQPGGRYADALPAGQGTPAQRFAN